LISPSTPEATTLPTTELARPVKAPLVTIDPGQVIRINARFPGAPQKILFSYLPPRGSKAVHDPGYGTEGSNIQREGDLYHYVIDTERMHGGIGWWYFYSQDSDLSKRRAKVGQFVVRDVPRTLIGAEENFFARTDRKVWYALGAGALLGVAAVLLVRRV
jgi:hypothetical protein